VVYGSFANFAEAMAEGRGKAQADTLRKTRTHTIAIALWPPALRNRCSGNAAQRDVVIIAAGEMIPADGEVIEGVASVDESAITGSRRPSSVSPAATGAL